MATMRLARGLVLSLVGAAAVLSAAQAGEQQQHQQVQQPEAVGEPAFRGTDAAPAPRPRRASCPEPAAKSRGQCESCYLDSQCPAGYYCCPYMRKCVDSGSMACRYPIADCNPRCYDSACREPGSNACACAGCKNVGPGTDYSWREWANLDNSNDAGTLAKTCDDGGGGPALATTTKPTTKAAGAGPGAVQAGQGCTADTAGCLTTKEVDHFNLLNAKRGEGFSCPEGAVYAPNPTKLVFDCRLWKAAYLHSKDMGDNEYFAHDSLDGRSPWDRADAQGLSANGENIAAGRAGAQDVLDQWLNSDGHCKNMGNPGFKMAVVGYASVSKGYRHYWTQMFRTSTSGVTPDLSCVPQGLDHHLAAAAGNGGDNAVTATPSGPTQPSAATCPSCKGTQQTRRGNRRYAAPQGNAKGPSMVAPPQDETKGPKPCAPVAAKSRGQCETCFHSDQCAPGSTWPTPITGSTYCCPYLKRCLSSGTGCGGGGSALCDPRCSSYTCDMDKGCPQCKGCKGGSSGLGSVGDGPDYTYGWMEWANLASTANGHSPTDPFVKTCDDNGGGGWLSGAPGLCSTNTQGTQTTITLECEGGSSNVIASVVDARFGDLRGNCGLGVTAGAATCSTDAAVVRAAIEAECLGKSSCTVPVRAALFGGDPCAGKGVINKLTATVKCRTTCKDVPGYTTKSTSSSSCSTGPESGFVYNEKPYKYCTCKEYMSISYSKSYKAEQCAGSFGGECPLACGLCRPGGGLNGYGTQSCSSTCSMATQTSHSETSICLSCGANSVIDTVVEAQFGELGGDQDTCSTAAPKAGGCVGASAARVKSRVEDKCLGKSSCTVDVDASVFGKDPCPGTTKQLRAVITCRTDVCKDMTKPARSSPSKYCKGELSGTKNSDGSDERWCSCDDVKNWGYCDPEKSYYLGAADKCPKACGVCT